MIKKIDENEIHERIMSLWLQNVSEENIAGIMGIRVEEVHKSIYMPSYHFVNMTESRSGYGRKDGLQKGLKSGGRGRNQTSTCRHPAVKKRR